MNFLFNEKFEKYSFIQKESKVSPNVDQIEKVEHGK